MLYPRKKSHIVEAEMPRDGYVHLEPILMLQQR